MNIVISEEEYLKYCLDCCWAFAISKNDTIVNVSKYKYSYVTKDLVADYLREKYGGIMWIN